MSLDKSILRQRAIREHEELAIPTSNSSRGKTILDQITKDPDLIKHNANANFNKDFLDLFKLAQGSKLHKDYDYVQCVQNFAYPLFRGYYILHRENNAPLSYISWGFFDPKLATQFFKSDHMVLDPMCVNSGKEGWIIDIIAPAGHIAPIVNKATEWAKQHGYAPIDLHFIRHYANGKSRHNIWHCK